MLRVVIANITPLTPCRFIFICQVAHAAEFALKKRLQAWAPGSELVEIDHVTEGAACTVLAAREFIDNPQPLMIANSDQYVDVDIGTYLHEASAEHLDGCIMTMYATDPKWSFVRLGPDGFVNAVAEKQPISHHGTVGIYNFSRGADFVRAADRMISKNARVNNEFYVAPVYNELLAEGAKIGIFEIGSEGRGMHGLGTPGDLEAFLRLPISRNVIARLT